MNMNLKIVRSADGTFLEMKNADNLVLVPLNKKQEQVLRATGIPVVIRLG